MPADEPTINFETVRKDYEDLDPKVIQPVGIIPDYVEPTRVLDPIVVVAPSGCFCVEGWEMVQKALKEQEATIRCHVAHVQEVSENELAIRKVAVRAVPEGERPATPRRSEMWVSSLRGFPQARITPSSIPTGGQEEEIIFQIIWKKTSGYFSPNDS